MPTFPVADVAVDRAPLPCVAPDAWLRRLGLRHADAFALGAADLVDGPAVQPLALAAQLAFSLHRPLVLTPDAVWLTLAQGLAQHVDLHAEALGPRLVRHAGKLDLDVRRDDFVLGAPGNDWPAAVNALAARVEEHLGSRARLFVADFSTTTPLDRTASQVALLGAMRNHFNYSVSSLCGIPEITLTGTPDDWANIRRRVRAFGELDLQRWADRLDPVLAQLEATARGQVDRAFWRRIYKLEQASGGDRFQGWLADLFPYLGTPPRPNPFEDFDPENPFDGLKPADLPSGRTQVPFTWKFPDAALPRVLTAGLFGCAQDPGTGAIGTVSGWVVGPPARDTGFRRTPGTVTLLQAEQCGSLTSLAGLADEDPDLNTRLWLYPCTSLTTLDGIERLAGLSALHLHEAPVLTDAAILSTLPALTHLELNRCTALERVGPLPRLTSLVVLHCPKLPRAQIPAHAGLTALMISETAGLTVPNTTDPAEIAQAVNALRARGS